MKTLEDLKKMDLAKAARAIETDAGQALPGLRESLADAKEGKFAQAHTPEPQAKPSAAKGSLR
jgi:hypothetical protein